MSMVDINKDKTGNSGFKSTLLGGIILIFSILVFQLSSIVTNVLTLFICSIGFGIIVSGDAIQTALRVFRLVFFSDRQLDHPPTGLGELADFDLLRRALKEESIREQIRTSNKELFNSVSDVLSRGKLPAIWEICLVENSAIFNSVEKLFSQLAAVMPLFGLCFTLLEMIAIFSSLEDGVSISVIGGDITKAFSCTLIGAALSVGFKMIQLRVQERADELDRDLERLQVVLEELRAGAQK